MFDRKQRGSREKPRAADTASNWRRAFVWAIIVLFLTPLLPVVSPSSEARSSLPSSPAPPPSVDAPETPDTPTATLPRPRITAITPDPVVGTHEVVSLTIHGTGFAPGFMLDVATDWGTVFIESTREESFISSNELQVGLRFGSQGKPWSIRVVNPDGTRSPPHILSVVAPVPEMHIMGPVRAVEGASDFELTVYGRGFGPDSRIRWNGEDRPTTRVASSDRINAYTIGLRTTISSADIAEAGQHQVTVYTPPPGGGISEPIMFVAQPRPFYQSRSFYLLVVGGFILFGGAFHYYRLRILREEELEDLVRERTQSLEQEKRKTEGQARQLKIQAEELQSLDRAKARFFANISHEFRTPLSMIRGPVEDALNGTLGPIDGDTREQLTLVHRSTRRMERLIEQVLELSRMESAELALRPRRQNLVRLVEEEVQTLVPLAERHQVALKCIVATRAIEVDADVEKLRAIIDNLLSNAIKFTPSGGSVVVTVSTASEQAFVQVEDTGVGIPEDELANIFDRFYQSAHTSHYHSDGLGIGLALTHAYVELHGGSIRVDSAVGEGTTFTVTLPLSQENGVEVSESGSIEAREEIGISDRLDEHHREGFPQESEIETPSNPPYTQAPRPSILIVEDNSDVRDYLRRHLSPSYETIEAQNGKEALERVRTVHPDLVLSDIMMPTMDGTELCRRMKADDELAAIPVVLLTARAGEDERIAGLECGADAYVEKPFSMPALKARIENLITLRREMRDSFAREISIEPAPVSPPPTLAEQARAVIEQHLSDTQFSVGRLAEALGMTRSTLTRRFKKEAGCTPWAFIREVRLEHAAELLKTQPDMSIERLARKVGYRDPVHFSQLFREWFGV